LEQAPADVGNDAGSQPRVPALVPDRDDGGEDAGEAPVAIDSLRTSFERWLPEYMAGKAA
ncbi:MAG: hypothetical protein JSV48_00360, partial [Bradyrhizobium sp.]